MSVDSRPARPVTVSVPGQREDAADVLTAGPAPALVPPHGQVARRRAALGALAALGVAAAAGTGVLPWGAAPPAPEPVSFSLLTPAPVATARASEGGAAFVTLRLRVAVRNDSAAWVTLEDVSLGAYRATGDGLGALPPGGLASVMLERLVVCDAADAAAAPGDLQLDVLAAAGPAEVHLALVQPAGTLPSSGLPACT